MLRRTANVSIIHRAGLAGMESGIANEFGIKVEKYHDSVVYNALIQAGVHSIRRIDGAKLGLPGLGLNKRIIESDGIEYYDLFRTIKEMLDNHAVNGQQSASQNKLHTLGMFLTDLIYSLKTSSAMIVILPIPKVEDYYGLISPHIISAISNILPNVNPTEILTPIPQLSIKSNEVEIFEEIIESHVFSAYSDSHSILENTYESDFAVLNDVSIKARSVWQRFSNTVDLKNLS